MSEYLSTVVQNPPNDKEFKKFVLEVSKTLSADIVRTYFQDEHDKRILEYFRGFPLVLAKVLEQIVKNVPLVDVGERQMLNAEAEHYYRCQEPIKQYHQRFFGKYPELAEDMEVGSKLVKFTNALMYAVMKRNELTPDMKHFYASTGAKAFQDIAFIEQKQEITDILAPRISYLNQLKEENLPVNSNSLPVIGTNNIYFKLYFTYKQKKRLQEWLAYNDITPSPAKVVNFMSGQNQQVEINPERLHHLAYLIFRLNTDTPKLFELNFGKGVFKHFQEHIFPFSKKGEKRELKDFKREVISKNSPKTPVITTVEALLTDLKKK